jgi:hypothetical protein
MPRRRHKYVPVRDQVQNLSTVFEHRVSMGKSSTAAPRLPLKQAQASTTRTSRARAVRSTATSWAQDDEDDEEDDDFEVVENSAAKSDQNGGSVVGKWLKKAVKKVVSMRSLASSCHHGGASADKKDEKKQEAREEEFVDVEEEFLRDVEALEVRYGGADRVPWTDEFEVENLREVAAKTRTSGSAGRGFRDDF